MLNNQLRVKAASTAKKFETERSKDTQGESKSVNQKVIFCDTTDYVDERDSFLY